MGGRKPSPLKRVLGDLSPITAQRKTLQKAISLKDPAGIAVATFSLFTHSKPALANLASAINMLSLFDDPEIKNVKEDKAKSFVTDYWNNKKVSQKLESLPEIDRILIDSALKIINRKGKL